MFVKSSCGHVCRMSMTAGVLEMSFASEYIGFHLDQDTPTLC